MKLTPGYHRLPVPRKWKFTWVTATGFGDNAMALCSVNHPVAFAIGKTQTRPPADPGIPGKRIRPHLCVTVSTGVQLSSHREVHSHPLPLGAWLCGSSPGFATNLPQVHGALPQVVSLLSWKMGSIKHTLPTFPLWEFLRGEANETMNRSLCKDSKVLCKHQEIIYVTALRAHTHPWAERHVWGGGVPSSPWNGHRLEEGIVRPVPWVPLSGGAEHTSALSAIHHGVVIN